MGTGDKMAINTILRSYKTERGEVNYPAVLSVPMDSRIPVLAKQDFPQIAGLITAALTLAFEGTNLKRFMSASQIVDLAETIIDSSNEDYLSMEDLMLFLQKFVRGEYGKMYESMDIPKFMQAFEDYRQERHTALITYKENQHLQYKGSGDANRISIKSELDEKFYSMANQLSSVKKELQEKVKENNNLKRNINLD